MMNRFNYRAGVQRSGVVHIKQGSNAEITVNGIDIIEEVYRQIFNGIKPATDYNSNFAGIVTLIVEVTSDREEE